MSAVYEGRRVLVTGGLGFIGSGLTRALVQRGARARVFDSLLPHCGGSPRNLGDIAARVEVVIEDTRNRDAVNAALDGVELVFHLAGSAGPGAGATDFYTDLDVACLGTWHVLEGVRLYAPGARIVFASSHHVYAPAQESPVAESAPLGPDTLFGAHQLSGERYGGVYVRAHGLDVVVARLTTVFGPRQRLQSAGGALARALDAALHDDSVPVYGGGGQRGDYLYVTDALDALLALGLLPAARGLTVNVGSGRGVPWRDAAAAVVAAVGRGRRRDVALEGAAGVSDQRDFVADVSRLRALGVAAPRRSFEDALRETVAWYLGNGA